MKIHIVTIAYGLADDTKALYGAAVSERHEVQWHLFLHSQFEDVGRVCKSLARKKNVTLYDYGTNRGVAKSWNEGILAAYEAGADVVILSNDDIMPAPGDLDKLAEAAMAQRNKYIVKAAGYNKRSDIRGDVAMGFTAINPKAIEVIGMFDEQFFPMYYEDIDWRRRGQMAGLHEGLCAETNVVHKGSTNIHTVPGLMEQNRITFAANNAYYIRKWGGEIGKERFRQPFDDIRFGLRIAPCDRGRPYWGYERTDHDIVKF